MKRKATAILEYSFVIMIVLGVLYGTYYIIKRSVQSQVKKQSDVHLGHGQGLEWPGTTLTWRDSEANFNRNEDIGGTIDIASHDSSSYTSIFIPVPSFGGMSPMKHKNASRAVQDSARNPDPQDNPEHKRNRNDKRTNPKD